MNQINKTMEDKNIIEALLDNHIMKNYSWVDSSWEDDSDVNSPTRINQIKDIYYTEYIDGYMIDDYISKLIKLDVSIKDSNILFKYNKNNNLDAVLKIQIYFNEGLLNLLNTFKENIPVILIKDYLGLYSIFEPGEFACSNMREATGEDLIRIKYIGTPNYWLKKSSQVLPV